MSKLLTRILSCNVSSPIFKADSVVSVSSSEERSPPRARAEVGREGPVMGKEGPPHPKGNDSLNFGVRARVPRDVSFLTPLFSPARLPST